MESFIFGLVMFAGGCVLYYLGYLGGYASATHRAEQMVDDAIARVNRRIEDQYDK